MIEVVYSLCIVVFKLIFTLIVAYNALGRSTILRRVARAGQARDAAVQCDRVRTHEMACQSQCTYAAVRKSVGPYRFQPLSDNSDGSFQRYLEH